LTDPYNLQRFVDAQTPVFDQVLHELESGKKQTHWMWFVFPQIDGLGQSSTAKHYSLASVDWFTKTSWCIWSHSEMARPDPMPVANARRSIRGCGRDAMHRCGKEIETGMKMAAATVVAANPVMAATNPADR
jgi:hypothetical protein